MPHLPQQELDIIYVRKNVPISEYKKVLGVVFFSNVLICPIWPSLCQYLHIKKLYKNSAPKKLIKSIQNGLLQLCFSKNGCVEAKLCNIVFMLYIQPKSICIPPKWIISWFNKHSQR